MSGKHLTVAVVIPTIPGREDWLDRALESVKNQRRKPDQLIIETDAGRTGAWATRNRALLKVRTDVVAWLDDDDWLRPNHLLHLMRAMKDSPNHPDLVYPTPVMEPRTARDPTAVTVQGRWVTPWGVRFGPEQAAHIRRHGSFIPMTHAVRTEVVREIEGFRAGYYVDASTGGRRYRGEDEDYLIRLLDHGAVFEHLPVKTWHWNNHPATSTAGRGA
jgi:glycosyltransferase involved in cell wall biosynthesis